jgi:hypothetical protein
MDGMIPATRRRSDPAQAKHWLGIATYLYLAWIVAELVLPMGLHVHVDAYFVTHGALSVGTHAALALGLRSLAFLIIDRLAPAKPGTPPAA